MKKKIIIPSILGVVFFAAALGLFFFLPAITNNLMSFDTANSISLHWIKVGVLGLFDFSAIGIYQIAGISIIGICALLLIVHIIVLCIKRHPLALLVSLAWLVGSLLLIGAFVFMWTPEMFTSGDALNSLKAIDGYQNAPYITYVIAIFNGMTDAMRILWMIIAFVPVAFLVAGFVLLLLAVIFDLRFLASLSVEKKQKQGEPYDASGLDSVIVVHEDQAPALQQGAESLGQEVGGQKPEGKGAYAPAAAEGEYEGIATPRGGSSNQAFTGPFLIQYINTYAPEPAEELKPNRGEVPLSEIQGAITGEKPLTAEEIRKIVREELEGEKKPAQPVIVTVPSPVAKPEPEQEKPLSSDDIRAIIAAELQNALGSEDDILVEPEEAPALTAEEIRAIIAEELSAARPQPEDAPAETISEQTVRDLLREELSAFRQSEEEKARQREEEEQRRAEEEARHQAEIEEAKRKAVEEALAAQEKPESAPALTADDIRAIIAEALASQQKPEEEPKPEQPAFDPDAIRALLREELRLAQPIEEEKIAPVTVVVKHPEPAPEPVPAPRPAPAPAPVVSEPAPEEGENKIIRIPFPTRMVEADDEMKANYNELKSEILSYGVKSRVSNSGDTFRLHKVTFVKITIAGKSLKLYFALNPADYANTTLPIQDASHKNIYREIPLVFKVKSELSMRRAKQLIADVMERHGIEQGRVELRDHTESLRDYKAAGTRDEDEDED